MNDSFLKLTDKTIVLAGRFGLLLQNLAAKLAENGADVALLTDDVKGAQRLCQNISDLREVSDRFGRAAAIEATIKDAKDMENLFSRSAELFGTAEVYIDAHLWGMNLPFQKGDHAAMETEVQNAVARAEKMTAVASQFLKGRTRGRIIFLYHELDQMLLREADSRAFDQFSQLIKSLAADLGPQNISVNALAVGVNEEYLLTRFSKTATIQKALAELQQVHARARLVDYNEIANFVGFLSSPLSQGLSGQIVSLNHGTC